MLGKEEEMEERGERIKEVEKERRMHRLAS